VTDGLAGLLPGALGTLQGLLVSSLVLLTLFIGFCILFNLPKLRPSGRGSRVVRSLDEAIGRPAVFHGPDTPRGRVDQLDTPELRESRGRNVR
jgi:hypothetical protein